MKLNDNHAPHVILVVMAGSYRQCLEGEKSR